LAFGLRSRQDDASGRLAGLSTNLNRDDLFGRRRVGRMTQPLVRGVRQQWWPGIVAGERRRAAASRSTEAFMTASLLGAPTGPKRESGLISARYGSGRGSATDAASEGGRGRRGSRTPASPAPLSSGPSPPRLDSPPRTMPGPSQVRRQSPEPNRVQNHERPVSHWTPTRQSAPSNGRRCTKNVPSSSTGPAYAAVSGLAGGTPGCERF
jgi:hypothetical protein